jgi:transcriptional regulator with XRE-family HTH domain
MRLFNGDRKRMCIQHLENPNWNQEKLAKMFSVERSTVSKILKAKDKWMNVSDADINRVAKHRPSKFPGIESRLIIKLREISQDGTILSDALIRSKAKEVAQDLDILDEKFKASSGWVDNFKSRWGIRRGVMTKGMEEAMNSNAPPECVANSRVSPHNRSRTSYHGAELDNGVESEDSPEASSPIPLQPSWSQPPSSENPPTILYEPKQGPGIGPDVTDAEQAMDTVLSFVDAQGQGWITAAERNALQHVKLLLLQTGQGLPYQREY